MNSGIVNTEWAVRKVYSPFSVPQMVTFILMKLHNAGMEVYLQLDHAENARQAGLELPESRTILFGKPQLYNELLTQCPELAFELPFRVSVFQDDIGAIYMHYTDLDSLAKRYDLEDSPALEKATTYLNHLIDQVLKISP